MSVERKYILGGSISSKLLEPLRPKIRRVSLSSMLRDPSDEVEAFWESEQFGCLSPTEKRLSRRTVALCYDGAPWGIGHEDASDGLFIGMKIDQEVESVDIDALVLSGALGAELNAAHTEYYGEPLLQINGDSHLNLASLKLIGAVSLDPLSIESAGATFTVERSDGKVDINAIGADMHGDFGMWQVSGTSREAISPAGAREPFSPAEVRGVRAYHSVEIDIVRAVITHLASRMSEGERTELFNKIAQGITTPLKPGSHAFGDYGSHDYYIHDQSEGWEMPDDSLRGGQTLDTLLVAPQARYTTLNIVSHENSVTLDQVRTENDSQRITSSISIPDTNLVDLISTIASSDQGRVSPSNIYDLLKRMLIN